MSLFAGTTHTMRTAPEGILWYSKVRRSSSSFTSIRPFRMSAARWTLARWIVARHKLMPTCWLWLFEWKGKAVRSEACQQPTAARIFNNVQQTIEWNYDQKVLITRRIPLKMQEKTTIWTLEIDPLKDADTIAPSPAYIKHGRNRALCI